MESKVTRYSRRARELMLNPVDAAAYVTLYCGLVDTQGYDYCRYAVRIVGLRIPPAIKGHE